MCLSLSRKSEVKVLPEHKIWWRAMRDSEMTTASGETINQEWIDEISDLIWG